MTAAATAELPSAWRWSYRATTMRAMSNVNARPTSVRLTPDLARRLRALAPKLARIPTYAALLGVPSLSKTIRLALLRGMEVLEEEVRGASK